MTKRKPNAAPAGGSGDAPEAWDFRLDRSGLMIAAGRYLQLRICLGLLFLLIGAVAGFGTVQLEWISL